MYKDRQYKTCESDLFVNSNKQCALYSPNYTKCSNDERSKACSTKVSKLVNGKC